MLPKIDLLLITIILNGSNLMSEHQWLGSMAKQPLFVQALSRPDSIPMSAHIHGSLLNSSKLADSLGVSSHTIRSYLDLLEHTFMVRVLMPAQSLFTRTGIVA